MRILLLFVTCFLLLSCDSEPQTGDTENDIETVSVPPGYVSVAESKEMKKILCQCWENKEDWDEAKRYGVSEDIDMVFRGYCFYEDGTLVKNPRGYFESGTWELNDTEKPFTIKQKTSNETKVFKLAMLSPTVLKIKDDSKPIQEYTASSIKPDNVAKDPFHPDNNRWRIKPFRSESSSEIKQRLKSSIHFYVLLYDHFINSGAQTVSFIGYPSCFKWYSGGIYIQNEKKLNQKWINCFFNREEAMAAYKIAEKLMTYKYNWPEKENNWMKLNVAVLKQIEARLDSIH